MLIVNYLVKVKTTLSQTTTPRRHVGECGKKFHTFLIWYLVEVASSFMLPLLYLKENTNLQPEMVVAPTDSVDMVQKTANKYH